MEEDIILTSDGKKKLEKELQRLIHDVRPEVIEELKVARAQGDLSENADYDAARARQSEVEAEIKKIETMLANCRVIDGDENTTYVRAGTSVTIEIVSSKKRVTYQIRGSVEADPLNGIISNSSPLALAIIGRSIGEIVKVEAPKPYEVKIIAIA